MWSWECGSESCDWRQWQTFPGGCWRPDRPAAWLFCMACHQSPEAKQSNWYRSRPLQRMCGTVTLLRRFWRRVRPNVRSFVTVRLTASLELEDVEGDSGEEEGEERSDGDGEEELDEVLLRGAGGRTMASPSGTLLLHWSSCWDSETSFPTERQATHVNRTGVFWWKDTKYTTNFFHLISRIINSV